MEDASAIHLQVRLKDSCGDNGMISVVIARPSPDFSDRLIIDTWLMSCRVLGRQVEHEVLNALVESAESKGFRFIEGHYLPTEKNALVRDHFEKLGFRPLSFVPGKPGSTAWELDLKGLQAHPTFIRRDVAHAEKEVSAT
jgi:FkbH-like protein